MAYKFGNESHLLPNLYARVQRFSAIRGVSVKKKESPNSRSGKWTPLTLNDENLVLINNRASVIFAKQPISRLKNIIWVK